MGRTRGRRRRPVEHDGRTFAERRDELFREAAELGVLCGADIALVVFDPAGNAYAFGSPDSAEGVLRRQFPVPADHQEDAAAMKKEEEETRAVAAIRKGLEETRAAVMREEEEARGQQARIEAMKDKVRPAIAPGRRFWWEADVSKLSAAELPEFLWALQQCRDAIRRRADTLLADTSSATEK
ncbi:hypothetical protein ACQ4PT_021340 [Festuca glaucescens]